MISFDQITEPAPSPSSADWNDDGYVILKGFLPEELMTAYEECWLASANQPGGFLDNTGWQYPTPYMDHKPLADLFCYGPLQEQMTALIGEPAGLHLCLTGWRTTTRNWHQDSYLNPPHVGDYYIAAWVALADIHPDSGPFQLIRGSHRWRQVTQGKIAEHVDLSDKHWPTHSEKILTPVFEAEIKKRKAEITTYLPSRGDVLLWHGRLLHRGSLAVDPSMERRAVIAHFSGINHRQDMPAAVEHNGGWLFPIGKRNW